MEDHCNEGRTIYRDAKGREISEAEFQKITTPTMGGDAKIAPQQPVKTEKEVMENA
jgi:hypothetical protein